MTLSDRATLSNMSPEYGATMGFFPVDDNTLDYLKLTGRETQSVKIIEEYLKHNYLFRTSETEQSIEFTKTVELNLDEIVPVVAGPKRPQDMIPINELNQNFLKALISPHGFNGFNLKEDVITKKL